MKNLRPCKGYLFLNPEELSMKKKLDT